MNNTSLRYLENTYSGVNKNTDITRPKVTFKNVFEVVFLIRLKHVSLFTGSYCICIRLSVPSKKIFVFSTVKISWVALTLCNKLGEWLTLQMRLELNLIQFNSQILVNFCFSKS